MAVVADGVSRRILEPALDGREISQLDHPAVGGDRHVADVIVIGELTADAHQHPISARVDGTRRHDAVLAFETFDYELGGDAERREPLVRKLHVDAFGLFAEDVRLFDHRHFQQAALDVLADVRQLDLSDAIALDGIEQAVDIAVLIVEDWTDYTRGQIELDVAQLLACLVPGFQLIRFGSPSFHGDGHAAIALACKGGHLLEVVELLELFFHAVEHLVLHLLCSGAGPLHHRGH